MLEVVTTADCRPKDEDSRLIDRSLAGCRVAFGELACRYQDRLYLDMKRLVGCHAEALDLVQETMLHSLRRLSQFRGESTFYTWLYSIAFNAAMSWRRRRRPTVSSSLVMLHLLPREDTPVHEAERHEFQHHVLEAIAALDDSFREALLLRVVEHYDYQTISRRTGVSVATVRTRLHRARLKVLRRLKPLLSDE